MGVKDTYQKQYLSNPKYFSDIINFYFYGGRKIVKEKELVDINPDKVKGGIEHFRDVVKVVKRDNNSHYCIIGIENQTRIDKTMPVRCMVYDANNLDSQIRGRHILNKSKKLIPVITLVLYWGAKPWTGPKTLNEMYDTVDKEILNYLPTYKINLIEPNSLTDKELNKLGDELKHLFTAVKFQNDKIKLEKYIDNSKYLEKCPIPTALMFNVMFGMDLQIDETKGEVNMCKAVRDMKADSRAEGLLEGKIEAIIEIGKQLNWSIDEIIANLVSISGLTKEEATEKALNF